ncbi:uncharacterized protein [Procambarus clarkii]|uniref:uncharacterized protein n=1 Tax=Procambarus clarkii TaxID=6728 RepID=UPI0037422345
MIGFMPVKVSETVAWVAALLWVTEVFSACEPDCSGKNPMDLVEDPLNCTNYYICVGDGEPSDVPIPCDSDTSFNAVVGNCSGPADCHPTCTPSPCHLTCTGNMDMISDPKDCSIYYICSPGNIIGPYDCPADRPYFNGETCVKDNTVCCGDLCNAYCQAGIAEIADPYDCHKFYMCPEAGPAEEKYHFTCPSGGTFDVAVGQCVVGAPCNILCSGGGTDPPSPDCQESMTCTAVGLFPMCTTCYQQYFNCHTVGQPATVETCTGSLLFSTNPSSPYCMRPEDCL